MCLLIEYLVTMLKLSCCCCCCCAAAVGAFAIRMLFELKYSFSKVVYDGFRLKTERSI